MAKIHQGWYYIYPVQDELIILKKPDTKELSNLSDKIEQIIVDKIVHPGLVKVTELLHKYPTLPLELLLAMTTEDNDYSEFNITKEKEDEVSAPKELDDSIDSIEFDLIP